MCPAVNHGKAWMLIESEPACRRLINTIPCGVLICSYTWDASVYCLKPVSGGPLRSAFTEGVFRCEFARLVVHM